MLELGLEKEYFIAKKGQEPIEQRIISAEESNLTDNCDECGFLAETRGEPNSDIDKAVLSIIEKEQKLKRQLDKDIELLEIPFIKLPEETMHNFRRTYGKGQSKDRGMYQDIKPKKHQTAGLHIHFSNFDKVVTSFIVKKTMLFVDKKLIHSPEIEEEKREEVIQIHQLDIPFIIRFLDEHFSTEIKETKRQKGMYELKSHGFEYRSLPNNIDLEKLTSVLFELLENL